jgi:hypothetical protein
LFLLIREMIINLSMAPILRETISFISIALILTKYQRVTMQHVSIHTNTYTHVLVWPLSALSTIIFLSVLTWQVECFCFNLHFYYWFDSTVLVCYYICNFSFPIQFIYSFQWAV